MNSRIIILFSALLLLTGSLFLQAGEAPGLIILTDRFIREPGTFAPEEIDRTMNFLQEREIRPAALALVRPWNGDAPLRETAKAAEHLWKTWKIPLFLILEPRDPAEPEDDRFFREIGAAGFIPLSHLYPFFLELKKKEIPLFLALAPGANREETPAAAEQPAEASYPWQGDAAAFRASQELIARVLRDTEAETVTFVWLPAAAGAEESAEEEDPLDEWYVPGIYGLILGMGEYDPAGAAEEAEPPAFEVPEVPPPESEEEPPAEPVTGWFLSVPADAAAGQEQILRSLLEAADGAGEASPAWVLIDDTGGFRLTGESLAVPGEFFSGQGSERQAPGGPAERE